LVSARVVIGMREIALACPPDERAYPGEGRKDHVHNKTQHKD
jgi:hypothetical protein